MVADVISLARKLSGETEDVLFPFCLAAAESWGQALKTELSPETCRSAFVSACACTALAGFFLGGDGGPETIRLGDVSLSGGASRGKRAEELRKEAARLMAPYVKDTGFGVKTV